MNELKPNKNGIKPELDCISRQALKDLGAECIAKRDENGNLIPLGSIDSLPPVSTETTNRCEDAISRQAVLEVVTEQERLASDRVRDTPSSFGNGLHTWVNPAYTRYAAQLSERSQFKVMIQTFPSVTPQQKTGRWISLDDFRGKYNDCGYRCSECGEHSDYKENFCSNCGTKMEVKENG